MLGRAVKVHHPAPQASRSSQSQEKPAALKPSQSSLLTSRSSWPAYNNPLKRSSSEMTGGDLWGSQGKTRKPVPQDANRLEKLHANIYFDENDFDDDNVLDFDDELPPTIHAVPATSVAPTLPSPQSNKSQKPPTQTPASSAPLQWSSSPASHLPEQPQKMAPPQLPSVRPAKATKRSRLPWADEKSGELDSHGPPLPPSARPTLNVIDKTAISTPQSKSKGDFPWNTTASAVKEEQKKLRQGHRKLVKDNTGDKEKNKETRKAAKKGGIAKVFLSDEQRQVVDLVAEKKQSVFFTGSAGTGKSVLLRETIKILRDKYRREPDRIAVTASTGLAACNVGGVTLHSFAGIGLGKEAVPELVKKIKKSAKAKQRWLRTKILIIDEISMVDGDLFDKLESIARTIRNNGRPFGGIQLIITGDFFQLPPVPDQGRVAKFAFDAASWSTSIGHTIGLTQVFRQKDPAFANMLNEMRLGKLTPKSIDAFRKLSRNMSFEDEFDATELFPTRIEVDKANEAKMRQLGGREMEFTALDGGSIQDVNQRDKLLQYCMAPQTLKLKKGAQVMLIKNIDETLVNGSVGKVYAFMNESTFEYFEDHEEEFGSLNTPDSDELAQKKRSLGQRLKGLTDANTAKIWPVVRFTIADGTTRDLLCQNETWKIELPSGEVQASRQQVPLILAWALSIHKAQGQTLDRVRVDLGKIFEKGQAYVALSRATCQEGLQILRFEPGKVMAHERVRKFYDSLYTANQALTVKPRPVETDQRDQGDNTGFMDEYGLDEDEVALATRYY